MEGSPQEKRSTNVDSAKNLSSAPSCSSLVDDVPKTPRKRASGRSESGSFKSYAPEIGFTIVGLAALSIIGFFVYRRFGGKK